MRSLAGSARLVRGPGVVGVACSTAQSSATSGGGPAWVRPGLFTNVHRPVAPGVGTPTAHAEVLDVGAAAGCRLAAVLRALLPRL